MNTKHTAGEWIVLPSEHNPQTEVYSNTLGYVIADAQGPDNTEAEANAKLIAAAPEMLAALKEAYRVLPYGNEALAIMINDIINKATK